MNNVERRRDPRCESNECAIRNTCTGAAACPKAGNAVENLKLRAGAAKPPIGIVPMRALVGVSRVLEDSGCVYAPGNFMAQPVHDAASSYDNALLRHRMQCQPLSGLVTPESYAALDDDSGLPHIDHLIAGLLILRTLMIRDGMLPADPGVGKRKRAAMEAPHVDHLVTAVRFDPAELPRVEADARTYEAARENYNASDEARRIAAEQRLLQMRADQHEETIARKQRDAAVATHTARVRAEGVKL